MPKRNLQGGPEVGVLGIAGTLRNQKRFRGSFHCSTESHSVGGWVLSPPRPLLLLRSRASSQTPAAGHVAVTAGGPG